MKSETRIVTADTDPAELDAWIAPAFSGVALDDIQLNNSDEMGSDDVPHLQLTQETPANLVQTWGEWGCSREIRWADHAGDARGTVYTDRGIMSAGQYAVAFARHNNMRLKLGLRWPCFATV